MVIRENQEHPQHPKTSTLQATSGEQLKAKNSIQQAPHHNQLQ